MYEIDQSIRDLQRARKREPFGDHGYTRLHNAVQNVWPLGERRHQHHRLREVQRGLRKVTVSSRPIYFAFLTACVQFG